MAGGGWGRNNARLGPTFLRWLEGDDAVIRSINLLTVTAAASLLVSCSSAPQSSAIGTTISPLGSNLSTGSVTPLKDCGGAGGVKVKPCPVHLNKHTKSGVIVTVKGPGVVNSYLGKINGCFNGQLCYNAERYGSSETKWLITPGQACGSADVEFDGVNASGSEVGYFFLKVANHYCP